MERIISRVTATPEAIDLIQTLRAKHGQLMFFQSGGCCDGSSPMCYSIDDIGIVGSTDVYLGSLDGVPFYIGQQQFEYWKHTQIIIDVVDGMGGMFSLENGSGKRFLTRSRLFSEEEWQALGPVATRGES